MNAGIVLDASALLALLLAEPGADRVKARLGSAVMGSVNLAEIVSYHAKLGASQSQVETLLRPLAIPIIDPDERLAYDAGMLRPLTLALGLSLGDRYCLALARRLELPALTAERRWAAVSAVTGVQVELIR